MKKFAGLRPTGRTRQVNRNFCTYENMASELASRLNLTEDDAAEIKSLITGLTEAHSRYFVYVEPFTVSVLLMMF